MKIKITLDGYKCGKCSHEWVPRLGKAPKVCPNCKTTDWKKTTIVVIGRKARKLLNDNAAD